MRGSGKIGGAGCGGRCICILRYGFLNVRLYQFGGRITASIT